MKNSFKICFVFAGMLLFFNACKKEGVGGKSSVKGYAQHHGAPIPNCKIYIKYGATDFPGTNLSDYDATVTANTRAYYEFPDLRKGNYYLYGVGYDSAFAQIVVGGIGIKLRNKENLEKNIAISE
jgi:hypothetical protein